jgi:hypothetical protein
MVISIFLALAAASAPQAQVAVPIVTCASDGQLGPQPAPQTPNVSVRVPEAMASSLAYYVSDEGPDVLAPRGWACLGLSGSDGSMLFVAPDKASVDAMIAKPGTYDGPAIVTSLNIGATSGRFQVWEGIARYFPKFGRVIDRSLWQETMTQPLPDGPYPADVITARADRTISLVTPANAGGQGTSGYLGKGSLPVESWWRLLGSNDESALLGIEARLPADLATTAPIILDSDRYAK